MHRDPDSPFYLFETTTAKLPGHLRHIVESGDTVLWPVFIGGRDWMLVCREGRVTPEPKTRLSSPARDGERSI